MLAQPKRPHSAQIRVGIVSFICSPAEKKVPYASTKLLARGSDAVLGTSHCPEHPGFVTKGCRIVVARFVPLADAALAVRGGRVSPVHQPGPTHPCWDGEELGFGIAAGQGSPLSQSRPSAGTSAPSQRQRGDKNRFSQGVMTQTGEWPDPAP